MKICDLTQFYSPFSGGVKRYLHEKIAYVEYATEHEHLLIVPEAETKCVRNERSTICTIRSPLVSRAGRYRVLLNLRALDRVLEREQPDLIESGDPYQIGWRAIRAGRKLGVPVIGFYHSHFAEAHVRGAARVLGRKAGERLMDFAQRYVRRLYNSFAVTLVPSEPLARILRNWGVNNARVVSLGVDTNTFAPMPNDRAATRTRLGIPESTMLLLYVGRLSKEKNTSLLCRAFEILNTNAPNQFHLLVVGDGAQRKHLQELRARYANVSWKRYCSEPAELARLYRAADLFVHPGTQETFGLVALESQACATPVVGIRGSCMDEAILHDQSWWANEETPESLANAIMNATKLNFRALGNDARHAVCEKLSWPRVFERLFYIYEEICSKYQEENGSELATEIRDSILPAQ